MQAFNPQEVLVEPGSDQGPIFNNLRSALPGVPFRIMSDPHLVLSSLQKVQDPMGQGKRSLFLMRHRGDFLKKCPPPTSVPRHGIG